MISMAREWLDRMLGRGSASISVPIFDGVLKPNRLLDEAAVLGEFEAPEDLATDGQALYVADGARVWRVGADGARTEAASLPGHVTALACLPDGGFAVAIDGREVRIVGGAHDGRHWSDVAGRPLVAANAIAVEPDGSLLVTDGSATRGCEQWCHDLMELGRSGRICRLGADGGSDELEGGTEYAFGALHAHDGAWYSETWRHRVRRVSASGERDRIVVDQLPGYPARMSPAAGGGAWLTLFAGRTQLVEFVLREPAYRRRMIAEIDPRYWIAPAMSMFVNHLEPLQGAAVKQMGVLKPWAPPRAYGLVVRLDANGMPTHSLHSRVDGHHHGVVAALELDGVLYVLSKGARRVLKLSVADIERSLS